MNGSPSMRSLSRAEALVAQTLLAQPGASQVEQMRATGVPRRTFQATRQRVLRKGWIAQRLVPDPRVLGLPEVTFVLAQPFVEAMPAVVEAWRRLPGTVCLWTSGETIFVVRCAAGGPSDAPSALPLSDPSHCRAVHAIHLDLRRRSVPVFFDFEAVWARSAGLARSSAYPRGWGGPTTERAPSADRPAPPAVRPVVQLLEELGAQDRAPTEGSILSGSLLQRRLRRCLAHGWITRRAFLDPVAVHDSVDGFADRVAFVTASLKRAEDDAAVLARLVNESGLAPFLFVSDGRSLLLGVLASDAAPAPVTRAGPPLSPFEVLKATTTGIVTVREPLFSLTHVVDYRFDLLVDAVPDRSVVPGGDG